MPPRRRSGQAMAEYVAAFAFAILAALVVGRLAKAVRSDGARKISLVSSGYP